MKGRKRFPIPYTGKRSSFFKLFRQPKTMQECRKAYAAYPYVRPARRPHLLSFCFDDCDRYPQKSWKTQRKRRHQWDK